MIVVAIIGVLAAIAIPNFVKFQARTKQAEAKSNLRMWFTAQRALLNEKGVYSENLSSVGIRPERGNRYAYYFSSKTQACEQRTADGGITAPDSPNCVTVDEGKFKVPTATPIARVAEFVWNEREGDDPTNPGISGSCPSCNINGYAAANIDNESAGIDSWTIATKDGRLSTPSCGNDEITLVAGSPFNTFNDVDCD